MKLLSYILLITIPLACGGGGGSSDYNYPNNSEYNLETTAVLKSDTSNESAPIDVQNEPTKIIKDARLRFETKNTTQTFNDIVRLVKEHDGFIQNDQIIRSYDTESRFLDIRVPANKFESLIDSIGKKVDYFDNKSIKSKDVTEEFIDIEARLGAKQTLEKRYLELLSSAKNVSEILEIEKELAIIRADIEAAQGRLKYLQNKVSMSTIYLEFYKTKVTSVTSKSYGSKIVDAFVSGFNGLSIFFLGILHIWPFILILIIGIFILRRYLKKIKKHEI